MKTEAEGEKYKTGKAFHIYRPQMIDSNGWKVWGELNIDIEKGIQTIIIPQDFIDNAVYPVRHAAGLEFGYTTEGTSGQRNLTSTQLLFDNATGAAGTGISMSAYVKCDSNGSGSNLQYYLYNTSLNKVTNGITDENTNITNQSFELKTLNFASAPTLTAQTYYLAAWSDASGGPGGNLYIAYDTELGNDHWKNSDSSYNTWPDSLTKGTTFGDCRLSIYATYTAAGGGEEEPNINTLQNIKFDNLKME